VDLKEVPLLATPGRNEPCHCGSGKKYKNCHLDADESAAREARAAAQKTADAAAESAEPAPAEGKPEDKAHDTGRPHEKRHSTAQPWKGGKNTRALPKFSTPRRSGSS
jgi:methionyl aminopeptidase